MGSNGPILLEAFVCVKYHRMEVETVQLLAKKY